MTENVGNTERIVRGVAAIGLMGAGYTALGAREGRLPGLLTMMFGAVVMETAITRVCPLSAAFGMDTRTTRERIADLRRSQETTRTVLPEPAPPEPAGSQPTVQGARLR